MVDQGSCRANAPGFCVEDAEFCLQWGEQWGIVFYALLSGRNTAWAPVTDERFGRWTCADGWSLWTAADMFLICLTRRMTAGDGRSKPVQYRPGTVCSFRH